MNIDSIDTFICVVQHQTISAAAKALYISQSTVSHRIQMLENDLGIILFDRQKGFKRMELTNDGRQFYPLAIQWKELSLQMQQINKHDSIGKVRIGSMDSINQYLLPPIIYSIRANHPELQMEFVSYHSSEIYNRLNGKLLDVGFAFFPIRYDIDAVPVFNEPVYMISPPGSIYEKGPINPASLKKSDQIFFTWSDQITSWNNEWWDEHDKPYVSVDSCALLTTFLVEPARWALCPASVASNLRTMYNVEIHELSPAPPNRTCYMLRKKTKKDAPVHKATEVFINAFIQEIQNHPWKHKNIGRNN